MLARVNPCVGDGDIESTMYVYLDMYLYLYLDVHIYIYYIYMCVSWASRAPSRRQAYMTHPASEIVRVSVSINPNV